MLENMPKPSMLPVPNRLQYAPSFIGNCQHLHLSPSRPNRQCYCGSQSVVMLFIMHHIVNELVQGVTAAAEMQAVSGRTVHRGPAVRPGAGDPEQVHLYTFIVLT